MGKRITSAQTDTYCHSLLYISQGFGVYDFAIENRITKETIDKYTLDFNRIVAFLDISYMQQLPLQLNSISMNRDLIN